MFVLFQLIRLIQPLENATNPIHSEDRGRKITRKTNSKQTNRKNETQDRKEKSFTCQTSRFIQSI